jgi:N-acetylglucosamine-6-phosphate deacetylase
MMDYYWVKNIVTPFSVITPGVILVEDGIITALSENPSGLKVKKKYEYAIPGFVDIHTHGSNNLDVMDGTKKALSGLAAYHLKTGTTSFLGSTLTAPLSRLDKILKKGREYLVANEKKSANGKEASLLGFHLEGPWLSIKNVCAHNPAYIIKPDTESLKFIEKYADCVQMVTMDYQGTKTDAFLGALRKNGIIAACGHDDTTDNQIRQGFKKGISHVTHIYCCASGFHKRKTRKHLGVTEMALMTHGISVEVIADNYHITRSFWDFITHNKPLDEIIVVSDTIRISGLPLKKEKKIMMEGIEITIKDGAAMLPDESGFAGSITNLYQMFLIMVKQWKVPIPDAVQVTSYNPAKKLGLQGRIGEIKRGGAADIVFLDKNLSITKILKNGIEL